MKKKLVKELIEYRLRNKLSQSKVAEQLGVHYKTISRWEVGQKKPNLIQAYHIKKFLEEQSRIIPEQKEVKKMLTITQKATKGSYIAKVTGVTEKGNLKREFIQTQNTFTKQRGVFEMAVDPNKLSIDDIIALKVVPPNKIATEIKENYYKIVKDPNQATALHEILEKIHSDKVKELLTQKTEIQQEKPEKTNVILISKHAEKGSYLAKIVGSSEKFGLKRLFIANAKDKILEVNSNKLEVGDIVALKVIGEKNKDSTKHHTEHYYRIVKPPETEKELHKIVEKLTPEQIKEIFQQQKTEYNQKKTESGVVREQGLER